MISVIMLTYNREMWVSQMVDCILKQTYRDFEYIIVDNGSTDGTASIVDSYMGKDERINVFHLDRPYSIGYARNFGLNKSHGEYIAYVDDDDLVDNDYLEFLYTLLLEEDADVSICGANEGDGITVIPQIVFEEKYVLSGEEAVSILLDRKMIRAATNTKLYKREILEKYPFDEKHRNEDIHTQYKYLLAAKKVVLQGTPKYYYRRHNGNVSGFTSNAGKWDAETMMAYLEAYHTRTVFIKESAPKIYYKTLYSEWSYMISMIEKIHRFQLDDCWEIERDLNSVISQNKEEFLKMEWIKDFEIEWVERYVS